MKKPWVGLLIGLYLMGSGELGAQDLTNTGRPFFSNLHISFDDSDEKKQAPLSGEDKSELQLHPLINFYMGESDVPLGRHYLLSPKESIAIDHPYSASSDFFFQLKEKGIIPLKRQSSFNEKDKSTEKSKKDSGATLFGLTSMADSLHIKYYLGFYDGSDSVNDDTDRISGRVQVNLMDPEPHYYQNSSYAGEKKTIGMGISYDSQNQLATENVNEMADYRWYEVDAFADMPVGNGYLTMEMAFQKMRILLSDFGKVDKDREKLNIIRQTDGNGWHIKTGYLFENFQIQPWASYETWAVTDDDGNDLDGYDRWKVGVTYFLEENMGNIKAGFEKSKTMPVKEEDERKKEDSINTFLLNFTINF